MTTLGGHQFTTPALAELLAVSPRKLASLLERGFVQPSIQEATGHGTRRLWSLEDAAWCQCVIWLAELFSVDTLRQVAKFVTETPGLRARSAVLTIAVQQGGFSAVGSNPEAGRHYRREVHRLPQKGIEIGSTTLLAVAPTLEGPVQVVVSMQQAYQVVERRLEQLGG
jgi:hypothetical protein